MIYFVLIAFNVFKKHLNARLVGFQAILHRCPTDSNSVKIECHVILNQVVIRFQLDFKQVSIPFNTFLMDFEWFIGVYLDFGYYFTTI